MLHHLMTIGTFPHPDISLSSCGVTAMSLVSSLGPHGGSSSKGTCGGLHPCWDWHKLQCQEGEGRSRQRAVGVGKLGEKVGEGGWEVTTDLVWTCA